MNLAAKQIIIVDPTVQNYHQLVADIPADRFHSVMTSPVGGDSRSNIGSDESISRVLRVISHEQKRQVIFSNFT